MQGGASAVLLPELPKKTLLSMHGGVDDAVFVEQRRGALDRWLKVLLLKPQTRRHPLLLQFLGLAPGWGSNELGFAGVNTNTAPDGGGGGGGTQMAELADPNVGSGKLAM